MDGAKDAYTIEEWSNFLRRVSIFYELEEDALREVAESLRPFSLTKGSTLYHEGDKGDALYIIQSGRVKIVTQEEDGKEKVLNYLGRGDTFGEKALLTGEPRSVTVKVDLNTNFLVLYKKDFETFLKKNPSVSLYLSRLISQRLQSASKPSPFSSFKSRALGFFCDLEREDQIVFLVNMSLTLSEQTRRKVLLLDLSPYGAELVQSLGMKPILSTPQMLRAEDLRNPKILERFTLIHPSGFEIMTLSLETFSGNLFRALPLFLATLQKVYDFVLIGMGEDFVTRTGSKFLDQISASVLQECDTIFYVSDGKMTYLNALKKLLVENEKSGTSSSIDTMDSDFAFSSGYPEWLRCVVLEKNHLALPCAVDFVVPWKDSVLKKQGHPYLTGPETETAVRALNRIARFIGKLQVGLAMGSGAAYGYALIGILKVLEREKIPIDFISGTSMGALIGSFYSAGKTVQEIESIAHSITKVWLRKNFLSDLNLPWPHGGILMGETVSRFLRKNLGEVEFKDLKIPFACAATNIMTGDAVVFREGKVWEAVCASLSLPLIFRPYKMGNRFLVDGGLVNPVPTSVIASMGADLLISVNLTSRVSEKKVSLRRLRIFPSRSPGIINIFFKMIYTMQCQVASARKDLAHIVIRPDTKNFSWVDFHRAKQIIPLGESAAEESLEKIKARLPFFNDSCRTQIHPRR